MLIVVLVRPEVPIVWVGSACGYVSDALPGTDPGIERACDHCGDGCVETSQEVTEFELAEEEIDPDDEMEEFEALCAELVRDARR